MDATKTVTEAFKILNPEAFKATTAKQRIALLKKLKDNIWQNKEKIAQALYADYHRSDVETNLADTLVVLKEINHAIANVEEWMRPKSVGTPLILLGTSSSVYPEPKGRVLIISPWNFPFNLSFVPLVSAISAGNVAIIKPSESTPKSSALIAEIVCNTFEPHQVQVLQGNVALSIELLELPFNHIFFTGSPTVGKIVMAAAAKNLASVTLELGGKSPVIVHNDANIKQAAQIVAWSKFINNGQVCIAGDYVLVHQDVHNDFMTLLKIYIHKYFIQEGAKTNEDYSRIVNEKQFARLQKMIDDALTKGAKAITVVDIDATQNFVSPLVLDELPIDAALLVEEIFGPILPVRTYKNIEEAIAFINAKERPLALYAFTKKQKIRDFILKNTTAGATVFNHVFLHHYNNELPFGGINNSGIGKSHGYFGFQEFTNMRAVVNHWSPINLFEAIYPPYNSTKRKLVTFLMKYLA